MNLGSANGSRAGSGVSRLAMMQARFQAQQLMEREQKLINILEERQEEAIRRIAYNNRDSVHSANSLSSTNSNSAGSSGSSYNSNQHQHHRRAVVRSAADMHTSPIGWDKSYPLRPMDPGLPPTEQPHPPIPRTPSSVGLYKRNSTAGLTSSNLGNKYSGGYGPKGHYTSLRNRGLSLDRLQNGNPGSLQTSPTRRPSYGLTRTRSQAQLLGHSSGEDSYASSSRPPSTYDAYSRHPHDVNLNRSHSHLYNRNSNGNLISATNTSVVSADFIDSPPSPPGSRKTSYTREYVRNLPTTVSGHSAPATRGRLTRRSQSRGRSSNEPVNNASSSNYQDHSSYSSQSSDKSETFPVGGTPANSYSMAGLPSTAPPLSSTGRQPSFDRAPMEPRARINSMTFRKSRSPGKRASRSPSRSPGRPRGGGSSPFGSDENDRVNNNDFLQQNQKSAVREREEEKRRLQAEMRRREQELLAKIKEQQRELETMKQEKGKVERELHRQEVMRDRERSKESFSRRKIDGSGASIPTNPSSSGRTLPRPPPINKRQVAVSRSSSSATSSSASKPDPDDEVEEEEFEDEQFHASNRVVNNASSSVSRRPPIKSHTMVINDNNNKRRNFAQASPAVNRRSEASPAVNRRNPAAVRESPAPNRRAQELIAKSEGLTRRSKDPLAPAPMKGKEPLTLSALRAAAGNTSKPNAKKPINDAAPPPAAAAPRPAAHKKPEKSNVRSRFVPKPRDDLTSCKNCGRNFADDRIEKHQEICINTSKKKRKAFDMTKKRVQGTEAETFVLKPKRGGRAAAASKQQEASKKKGDWRKKREEFIAALRAAKVAQRHLAAGGKISDLPPPPPSDNSDYIQCPHCGRRFNEAVAERHIPKCKDIKSNKRR